MRRYRNLEHGQALVEFALAAPLIFLMILGLFDVGRMVFINNELSEAAREGARWGAVAGRASTEAKGHDTAVTERVRALISVAPAPSISLSCTDMGGAGGLCGSGDLLTIEVSSSVSAITPIVGQLIGPMTISSQAQMTVH